MAARRINTYARAYSFGTDGSAVLAGGPISSTRPLERASRRAPAKAGLRMPLWAVVLSLAGVVFVLSFMLLGVRSQATEAAKRANALRGELARAREVIASLELKIDASNDPTRIHSIAVNRLGMSMPTEEQTVKLSHPPATSSFTLTTQTAQTENTGFFRLLLSLVGI